MTAKFKKSLALLLVVGILACSLCGCDTLDYRKAISLYNAGRYDAAAELFSELGDYEDASQLATLSHYWAALSKMDAEKYDEALPRFLKLGDYEDAEERATECRYQLALEAFEEGDLPAAEEIFLEVSDYRQTPEYLRQINWQKLFDAVAEESLRREEDGKIFQIYPEKDESENLTGRLFISYHLYPTETDAAFPATESLLLVLSRDSTVASYTAASTFQFDFVGNLIGSKQVAEGKLDITTCTPETTLSIESFSMEVDDNLGNHTETDDPAECLMNEEMAENLAQLFTVIPQLLADAGIQLTLQDIGFYAL